MVKFNQEIKDVLDEMILGDPRVRAGKMFGYPAYYAGEKLAICLYEEGVGVKLPAQTASELIETDENVIPFQPLGRPRMREWIQINLRKPMDYEQYLGVFDEAIRFVSTLKK